MSGIERRVLELSYKLGLTHIGSCLIASEPINAIYSVKKPNEPFILSSGHMGLALYCVLEAWGHGDAEKLALKHGTHPNRDMEHDIWASTGSLGMGVSLGVGMAIADKTRNVYIVMSDGELNEGMVWESLRIASDLRLENLRISVIMNGWSAYGRTDVEMMEKRLQLFYPCLIIKANTFNYPSWLQGQGAHYVTIDTPEKAKELGL